MASVRDFPAPRHPNFGKPMWCKWCGGSIPKVIDGKKSSQRLWHPACVEEFNLHTRLPDQFDYLVRRDGRRCRVCPEGAPIPRRWLKGPEITVSNWHRRPEFKHLAPVGSDEWMALVAAWNAENPPVRYTEIERVDWLEVDHRTPLWEVADLPDEERRWYFGPGNLWLLCGPHHLAKTRREAARRAEIKRLARAQISLPL